MSEKSISVQRAATAIRFNQAKKLDRYFQNTTDVAYGGNRWDAQIERLVLFRSGSKPCRRCGGTRRNVGVDEDGKAIWEEIAGSGWVSKRGRPPTRLKTAWSQWASKSLGLECELGEQLCPACGGRGWVERKSKSRRKKITARPNGGSRPGARGTPDAVLADPSGEVMEWLCRLRDREMRLAKPPRVASLMVIECYFGSNHSRVHLWQFTNAGVRLLRQAPTSGDLHPVSWLDNERNQAMTDHDHRNRVLIEQAELETNKLLEQAIVAWNTIVPERDAQTERRFVETTGI